MLSGIIAYQILQQENPQTVEKVKVVLERHPWYTNQRQARVQDVPIADHGLVLFMQAARWADYIRANDKQQHRALWHLHQLAVQARQTTVERANQGTRAREHPNRDGGKSAYSGDRQQC